MQSTPAIIVCLFPSIITVVLTAAGFELEVAAGRPPSLEQPDTPAPNMTMPTPAATRTISHPGRRRSWFAISPSLIRVTRTIGLLHFRKVSFLWPRVNCSATGQGKVSQLVMLSRGVRLNMPAFRGQLSSLHVTSGVDGNRLAGNGSAFVPGQEKCQVGDVGWGGNIL